MRNRELENQSVGYSVSQSVSHKFIQSVSQPVGKLVTWSVCCLLNVWRWHHKIRHWKCFFACFTFREGSDRRTHESLFFFTYFLWSLMSSQLIAHDATLREIKGNRLNWLSIILNSSVIRLGSAYMITRSKAPLCKLLMENVQKVAECACLCEWDSVSYVINVFGCCVIAVEYCVLMYVSTKI